MYTAAVSPYAMTTLFWSKSTGLKNPPFFQVNAMLVQEIFLLVPRAARDLHGDIAPMILFHLSFPQSVSRVPSITI